MIPNTRKEWLERFLWLADNNRPAMEYRRKMGIKFPQLHDLVKRIPEFRKELQAIIDEEKEYERNRIEKQQKLTEAIERTRRATEREAGNAGSSISNSKDAQRRDEVTEYYVRWTPVVESRLSKPTATPSVEDSVSESEE